MATFGYTTAYSSSSSSSVDRRSASPATPSSSGTVSSLTFRARLSAAGTAYAKGVIYSDNSGSPGTLLAVTDEISFTNTTQDWQTANFSGANAISIASGTQYWIGFHQQDPGTPNIVRVQSTGTADAQASEADTYSDGPAADWGTPTLQTGPLSVYVTYTESTGVNASVTQVAATMTLTGGTQSVASVRKTAITQVAANLSVTGGTQAVASIRNALATQVKADLTITPGTQAVSSSSYATITQVSAPTVITPGTQSITPTAYTYLNGTVAQAAASLLVTGGSHGVVGMQSAVISQVAGSLSVAGGVQAVGSQVSSTVNQLAAALTITSGTQAVGVISGQITMQINISGWKSVSSVKLNTGGSWKTVSALKIGVSDNWEDVV